MFMLSLANSMKYIVPSKKFMLKFMFNHISADFGVSNFSKKLKKFDKNFYILDQNI
jgi:hypothetical protein